MKNSNCPAIDTQLALKEVGMAETPQLAMSAFRQHLYCLKDWRIIYADVHNNGYIKLNRTSLLEHGIHSSVFRGQSLWIVDAQSACNDHPQPYLIGAGTYVDSNAASLIRSMTYKELPTEKAVQSCQALAALFDGPIELNPFAYLWESTRAWTPETVARCREAVAAIYSIRLDARPFSAGWGDRFRRHYREEAEAHADQLLADFDNHRRSYVGEDFAQQADLIEMMLLRTKIIELSSPKGAEHKLAELVRFMHEELHTLMWRELIVCEDILFSGGKSKLSNKMQAVTNGPQPLAVLKNCAWDLFLFRMLDYLSKPKVAAPIDFYIANLISFDKDIADIFALTELRAMALHLPSNRPYPIFEKDIKAWLVGRVGETRMSALSELLNEDGFASRAAQRECVNWRDILAVDREQLLHLRAAKSRRPA